MKTRTGAVENESEIYVKEVKWGHLKYTSHTALSQLLIVGDKGRHPLKKVVYFRALPELAEKKPPPQPPIRAT